MAEMVGTYSTIPDLGWAVVAQRSMDNAREDAGVKELNGRRSSSCWSSFLRR